VTGHEAGDGAPGPIDEDEAEEVSQRELRPRGDLGAVLPSLVLAADRTAEARVAAAADALRPRCCCRAAAVRGPAGLAPPAPPRRLPEPVVATDAADRAAPCREAVGGRGDSARRAAAPLRRRTAAAAAAEAAARAPPPDAVETERTRAATIARAAEVDNIV